MCALRQAYIGAAANGNGGRYRYYGCFSRQRYGRTACDAAASPPSNSSRRFLDQLANLLAREDDVPKEIERAFAELDADRR